MPIPISSTPTIFTNNPLEAKAKMVVAQLLQTGRMGAKQETNVLEPAKVHRSLLIE